MATGSMLPYDAILKGLLTRETPCLLETPITACLLAPSHVVDLSAHRVFSQIKASEIKDRDYKRVQVTGARVEDTSGRPYFHTDKLMFGDPVTLGPAGYLAFVFGLANGLTDNNVLLGISELAQNGAVEAQRSVFLVEPPADGWFHIQRG